MDLEKKKCLPCEGLTKALTSKEIVPLIREVKWILKEKRIERIFEFKNFKEAMVFVNKVAVVAERENHHPDIEISWNKVTCTLWTHALSGLSENDFILAAKINKLVI